MRNNFSLFKLLYEIMEVDPASTSIHHMTGLKSRIPKAGKISLQRLDTWAFPLPLKSLSSWKEHILNNRLKTDDNALDGMGSRMIVILVYDCNSPLNDWVCESEIGNGVRTDIFRWRRRSARAQGLYTHSSQETQYLTVWTLWADQRSFSCRL